MTDNIISRVMKAISGGSRPKSEEVAKAVIEADSRIAQVESRLADINPNKHPLPPGRRQVLESGTPEDVMAMDEEYRRLGAELSQLRFRRSELKTAHKDALAHEAVADAKQLQKQVADAVAHAEQVAAQLEQARQSANEAKARLSRGRDACRSVGLDASPLALDQGLAQRLADVTVVDGNNADQDRRNLVRELTSKRAA